MAASVHAGISASSPSRASSNAPGPTAPIDWRSGAVWAALFYVAIGPSLVAYRCWGLGVARAGPALASFFANLSPLFAALLSAALLGEAPHAYHVAAFALIVSGIVVSMPRGKPSS